MIFLTWLSGRRVADGATQAVQAVPRLNQYSVHCAACPSRRSDLPAATLIPLRVYEDVNPTGPLRLLSGRAAGADGDRGRGGLLTGFFVVGGGLAAVPILVVVLNLDPWSDRESTVVMRRG